MMNIGSNNSNAVTLGAEFQWLSRLIDTRLKLYFNQESQFSSIFDVYPPDLSDDDSTYSTFVRENKMSFSERCVLALVLAPHIKPQLLDAFFAKNSVYDRSFSEFGGIKGLQHSGFLPTGETALFILSGSDINTRFKTLELFKPDHFFSKLSILKIAKAATNEPLMSGALLLSDDFFWRLTSGAPFSENDYSGK